jgi:hypothetical protein
MLGWEWYGFDKKRVRPHYAKLGFLHPVGSMGQVVHSDASGACNGDALFLKLGWDRYRFDKKHDGPLYTELLFLNPMGSTGHVLHFGTSEV